MINDTNNVMRNNARWGGKEEKRTWFFSRTVDMVRSNSLRVIFMRTRAKNVDTLGVETDRCGSGESVYELCVMNL